MRLASCVVIYEDRLALDTPEGIQLELTLAGVGSRFTAALIDFLIEAVILVALAIVLAYVVGADPASSGYALAIWAVGFFTVFVGYNIAFEVLGSGRTPGKRSNG